MKFDLRKSLEMATKIYDQYATNTKVRAAINEMATSLKVDDIFSSISRSLNAEEKPVIRPIVSVQDRINAVISLLGDDQTTLAHVMDAIFGDVVAEKVEEPLRSCYLCGSECHTETFTTHNVSGKIWWCSNHKILGGDCPSETAYLTEEAWQEQGGDFDPR